MQPGDHGAMFVGLVKHVATHVFDRMSDPALLGRVQEMEALMCEQLAGVQRRATLLVS